MKMPHAPSPDPRSGAALFVIMLLLAALTLYGATAYRASSFDIRTVRSHVLATRAFHQADAGARNVARRIIEDVRSSALVLNSATHTVNYTAPTNLVFDPVTTLTRLADGTSYAFNITSRSAEGQATLQVVLAQDQKLKLGLFADRNLSFGPTARVYSYNSSDITVPVPADSTHDAQVGTNGSMGGNSTTVDGTIHLGVNSSGTPATYGAEFSSTQIAVVERTERLNPDPLGLVGGDLAADFARVATSNNNALAVGGTISNGKLTITGNVTLRAGSYYVGDIDLRNGDVLTADGSLGPVNLYVTGGMDVAPNARMNTVPRIPSNLRIYSSSSSTMTFSPDLEMVGFLYAPLATIRIQPNASIYGGVWGRDVNIAPNGDLFVDMDLFGALFGRYLMVHSWRTVLN